MWYTDGKGLCKFWEVSAVRNFTIRTHFKLLLTMAVMVISFAAIGGSGVLATVDDPTAGIGAPTPLATPYNVTITTTTVDTGGATIATVGGSVSVKGSNTTITSSGPLEGTSLIITAKPNIGYEVSSLVPMNLGVQVAGGAGVGLQPDGSYIYPCTVDGATEVTVTTIFKQQSAVAFTVAAPAAPGGGVITVNAPITSPVAVGTQMSVTAVPAVNFAFTGVTFTNTSVTPPTVTFGGYASGNTCTFLAPAYPFTITPVFSALPTKKVVLTTFETDGAPKGGIALAPAATGSTPINLTAVALGSTIEIAVTEPTGTYFTGISATLGRYNISSLFSRVSYDVAARKSIYRFTLPSASESNINESDTITITAAFGRTFVVTINHVPVGIGGRIEPYQNMTPIATTGGAAAANTFTCRYNEVASFYVVPDANYKIKDVVITPKVYSSHKDGFYTIGPINSDLAVNVTFVNLSDGVVDAVVDDGGPRITVKSIADIYDQLYDYEGNKRNEGATIIAPVDTTAMIDRSFFDAIRGRNVTIVIKGENYTWKINGKAVAAKDQVPSSSNLDVRIEKYTQPTAVTSVTTRRPAAGGTTVTTLEPPDFGLIAQKYMKQLSNYQDQYKYMVDVAYDGVLPFTGVLSMNVGVENSGLFGNLYLFNEETHKFEGKGSAPVNVDGDVSFQFNHASRYVIILSNKILTSLDIVKDAGIFEKSTLINGIDNTQLVSAASLFGVVIIGGIVLLVIMKRARRD